MVRILRILPRFSMADNEGCLIPKFQPILFEKSLILLQSGEAGFFN